MLCVRQCPDWCVILEAHSEDVLASAGSRARTRHVVDRFAIDFGLCMYCGICIEVCPFDALFWAESVTGPGSRMESLVAEREALRAAMSQVPVPEPVGAPRTG